MDGSGNSKFWTSDGIGVAKLAPHDLRRTCARLCPASGGELSRSNFSWDTFQCKRPNATSAASSGFDQPSMIVLASSRLLEPGARLWKVGRPSGNKLVWKVLVRSPIRPDWQSWQASANRIWLLVR